MLATFLQLNTTKLNEVSEIPSLIISAYSQEVLSQLLN